MEGRVNGNFRGERIAEGRRLVSPPLSQEELARRVGCSLASIAKYEQGKRTPTLGRLERIAAGLEQPVSFFFADNGVAS